MTTKSGLIQIISPKEGAYVPWRPFVEGTTSIPDATVWLIIHPIHASGYWVQPRINIKEGGDWSAQPYVGRPGNADVEKRYEIMAIGNPTSNIREEDVLESWPEAEYISQIVEVTRIADKFQVKVNSRKYKSGKAEKIDSAITEDALKQLTVRELAQKLSIGSWILIFSGIVFLMLIAFNLGSAWVQYRYQANKSRQPASQLDEDRFKLFIDGKDKLIAENNARIEVLKAELQAQRETQQQIPLTVFDKNTGNKLHIEKPIAHPGYYEFPIILHDGKNSVRIDQYGFAKRRGIKFNGE